MKINHQIVLKWLNENKIEYIENFDISKRSWLKAGGIIKIYITPKKSNEIEKLVNFFKRIRSKFYILGNISNTIVRDGVILTPIINLSKLDSIEKKNYKNSLYVKVDAGVSIPRFANFIMKQSYSGTEALIGIPGSIGGGIFMNASCYKDELTKFINKIYSINYQGEIISRSKSQAEFNWRNSVYQRNNELILGADFLFPLENFKNAEDIKKKSEKIKLHRKKIQENDNPNLGSLFATKNLYSDIKFISTRYLLLYLYHKLFLILINNNLLKKIDILSFRRKVNIIYKKSFDLDKNQEFSLSDKTINCLINKGSQNSKNAIQVAKHLEKIFKNKIRLENVILENIE